MPVTDTYIEKEAQINEEIERLRHASTQALLTRKDVIIVASVSCIYGLGSPVEYERVNLRLDKGQKVTRAELLRKIVNIHFERTTADLSPGQFRAIGNSIEIMPVNERIIYRLELGEEIIERIDKIDGVSRTVSAEDISVFFLFPAKHFITDEKQIAGALHGIKIEADEQVKKFEAAGKNIEAERLRRRTKYDVALIREVGYCNGIENYSRHFSGKAPGQPPDTLLSYFPHKEDGTPDFLTIIDESHVAIPQLRGMFAGDESRKNTLVEHGFRLPSAKDNRPLKFDEFEHRVGQIICTTATPGPYEREVNERIAEQVIRPTGLIDPEVSIRPVLARADYKGQIVDFISEAEKNIAKGGRVIATTLTKKMAEDLTDYLKEKEIKTEYVHSDIETLERIRILTDFRKGKFDCLIGVNLLREGLDLPEVSFIGILDADKEGFLRSETSLIQIIGRAARNVHGYVILYADKVTGSIERAIGETNRRRTIQKAYNEKHGITPTSIHKKIKDITEELDSEHKKAVKEILAIDKGMILANPKALNSLIKDKEKQMSDVVKVLDFETAALLRDEIAELRIMQAVQEEDEPKLKKRRFGGPKAIIEKRIIK